MCQVGYSWLWFSETMASNSSEDKDSINYVSNIPSLQRITLIAVAIKIWGYNDFIEQFCYNAHYDFNQYTDVYEEVCSPNLESALKKLNQLFLPESIKYKILNFVRPIALQWMKFSWLYCEDFNEYPGCLDLQKLYRERTSSYWRMDGVVIRDRLHKDVIDSVAMDHMILIDSLYYFFCLEILYDTACAYCMEEDITKLWTKVKSNKDLNLPNEKVNLRYFICGLKRYIRHFTIYWTALLINESSSLLELLKTDDPLDIYDDNASILINMVSASIASGNLIGLKYFWVKLTEQEIKAYIEHWISVAMTTLKERFNYDEEDDRDLVWMGEERDDQEDDGEEGDGQEDDGEEGDGQEGEGEEGDDDEEGDGEEGDGQEGEGEEDESGLSYESKPYKFIYQEYEGKTDAMCFLLSHLNNPAKLKEILETHAEKILHSLYCHWPLQQYFLSTFEKMLNLGCIQPDVYISIMAEISSTVHERRTEVLLRTIWKMSPRNLREGFVYFLSFHAGGMAQLLNVGDDATFDMILNFVSCEDRRKSIMFGMLKRTKYDKEDHFREFLYSNKSAISTIGKLASKYLSESHVSEFKLDIMSRHAHILGRGWILTSDFESLDRLFNWSSPSTEEIRKSKQKYLDIVDIYSSLILLNNDGLVDDFLNWYFETEEEINEFKKSFDKQKL